LRSRDGATLDARGAGRGVQRMVGAHRACFAHAVHLFQPGRSRSAYQSTHRDRIRTASRR